MDNITNKFPIAILMLLFILSGAISQAEEDDNNLWGDCNIKGNIASDGEKIYHVPGQKFYSVTKINKGKGERYFCTEEEARRAGWRKSKV